MALPFGMTKFVLGDIHDEPRDGAYRCVRSGAGAWPVLSFLVVSLPSQSEAQACLAALQGSVCHARHPALFHGATYGESAV